MWASFIFGVGVMLLNMLCTVLGRPFINAYFSSPINAGVLAMVGGLVIVPIISAIAPAKKDRAVDQMFANYEKAVK